MSHAIDNLDLAVTYALLIVPGGVLLWLRPRLLPRLGVAVLRMSVQLLLVGLYLHVLFEADRWWLSGAWLGVMLLVADGSVLAGSGLTWRRHGPAVFAALVVGTAVPLAVLLLTLGSTTAALLIPLAGMILGNGLRAQVVGLRTFHTGLTDRRAEYELLLTQGATRREAVRPFLSEAVESSLAPTLATVATIGLVSLPGMMTGVLLGGGDPSSAVRYQIAIMLAILAATAASVPLAIVLALPRTLDPAGRMRH